MQIAPQAMKCVVDALEEAVECAELSLEDTPRDPREIQVGDTCERLGYGAVMSIASAIWRAKDPGGAFVCGPCFGTVQQMLSKAQAALQELDTHGDTVL